jgi:hypothetical protein
LYILRADQPTETCIFLKQRGTNPILA